MTAHPSKEYLASAVLTASPEQLQLMLFDGAIRFSRQAREALQNREWETSCEKLLRAQNIVTEMQNGLRPEINPTLCEQFGALYNFIFRRLVEANIRHEVGPLDEALQILEHQRESWQLLLNRASQAIEPTVCLDSASGSQALSVQG